MRMGVGTERLLVTSSMGLQKSWDKRCTWIFLYWPLKSILCLECPALRLTSNDFIIQAPLPSDFPLGLAGRELAVGNREATSLSDNDFFPQPEASTPARWPPLLQSQLQLLPQLSAVSNHSPLLYSFQFRGGIFSCFLAGGGGGGLYHHLSVNFKQSFIKLFQWPLLIFHVFHVMTLIDIC